MIRPLCGERLVRSGITKSPVGEGIVTELVVTTARLMSASAIAQANCSPQCAKIFPWHSTNIGVLRKTGSVRLSSTNPQDFATASCGNGSALRHRQSAGAMGAAQGIAK